ncbi:hypothetical protein [Photobacterium alginatilyticum]|uniref:Uncharacterized protein n=1 Tax=Photobacterium alginatilyticum TaxID=1775171 RepID=A0ABW9YSJ3_9GAMM|nr:hypothetical protein [Photobacterium alginatilyticum]NBI56462.1 hypothetical protein [Photobacterium alginatilyticum]
MSKRKPLLQCDTLLIESHFSIEKATFGFAKATFDLRKPLFLKERYCCKAILCFFKATLAMEKPLLAYQEALLITESHFV